MLNPVQDRLGQGAVISTELVVPTAVVVLGAEDRGRRLSPGVEQFQDVMLFRLRGLLLAPGENRHFEPGENNQFQPGRNRQSVPGGCSQPRFECRF